MLPFHSTPGWHRNTPSGFRMIQGSKPVQPDHSPNGSMGVSGSNDSGVETSSGRSQPQRGDPMPAQGGANRSVAEIRATLGSIAGVNETPKGAASWEVRRARRVVHMFPATWTRVLLIPGHSRTLGSPRWGFSFVDVLRPGVALKVRDAPLSLHSGLA